MPWQAHSNQAHQLTGRKRRREAREGIKSLNLAVHLHETEKHSTSDKAVTKNLMRMRINCEFCCLLLNFHSELTRGLNAGTIKINSNVANNKHSFADYVPENNITRARGAIKNLHRHSGSQKKFACNLFELLLICISFRKTLNWNLHKNLRLNSVRGKNSEKWKTAGIKFRIVCLAWIFELLNTFLPPQGKLWIMKHCWGNFAQNSLEQLPAANCSQFNVSFKNPHKNLMEATMRGCNVARGLQKYVSMKTIWE